MGMPHYAFEAIGALEQVIRQFRAHDQHIAVADHRAQRVRLCVRREDDIGDFLDDVFAGGHRRVGEEDFGTGCKTGHVWGHLL
jgi:hypothetical protein